MPFAKYKNTPFLRYIVPIIPVGAKLAEGCKIKPENLNELIDELRDLSVDVGNAREDLKIKVFTE